VVAVVNVVEAPLVDQIVGQIVDHMVVLVVVEHLFDLDFVVLFLHYRS